MLYSNLCFIFIPIIYMIYNFNYKELSLLLLLLILVRIILATEKNLFIIEWLKFVETSLFLPIHKIIQIFLSFLVWMFLFQEYLDLTWLIAIWIWILVVLLLTSKENKKIQIDYKKWIFFLLLSNLMIIMSSSINKYITSLWFDIVNYMFLSWIFWSLYMLISKKNIYKIEKKCSIKKEIKLGLLKWFLSFFWFLFFLSALKQGPFVLVQMINTSSIFIPIILSVIIYKEEVNFKKVLAFIFFIFAVYLINI